MDVRTKKIAEELKRRIIEKYKLQDIRIFGSSARGEQREDSDIDILLLTSRPIDWREREAIIDALFDIEMAYDVLISILVKTSTEWENGVCTVSPVHQEISKEGVLA